MQNQGQITRLQCNSRLKEDLEGKINSLTEQQRGYVRRLFKKMGEARGYFV